MPNNLTMPRLSDTMEVGTIVKWHVKPGQKVKSGDVIADIETDKATMELQTFEDGVVATLAVETGKSVPVGTLILAWEGGATVGAPAAKTQASASAGGSSTSSGSSSTAVLDAPSHSSHANGERIFASPLAKKIAADSGVNLSGIHGTGPAGRIVRKDVEAALAGGANSAAAAVAALAKHGGATLDRAPEAAPIFKPKPLPEQGSKLPAAAATSVPPIAALMMPSLASSLQKRSVPLSNMRRVIAARLVESKTTIPHYQVSVSVRMDALLDLRKQLNEQLGSQGVKLSVNDFIIRASSLSMHAHPYINSRWNPSKGAESIELLDAVNVGVAISLPEERGGGLVVATIRNADQKGLRLISSETKQLADKARTKGLTPDEMGDSTFTISNLGMFGVDHFTAIINPPNAAILAVGGAIEQPVIDVGPDGKKSIGIGHVMTMTMSSDHRIIDGAMAAQYLATLKEMLEKPATLLV